jgi:hypothetical protein
MIRPPSSPSIVRQIDRSATAHGASICSSSTFWLGRSVGGECGLAALLLLAHCDTPRFTLEAVATRRRRRAWWASSTFAEYPLAI